MSNYISRRFDPPLSPGATVVQQLNQYFRLNLGISVVNVQVTRHDRNRSGNLYAINIIAQTQGGGRTFAAEFLGDPTMPATQKVDAFLQANAQYIALFLVNTSSLGTLATGADRLLLLYGTGCRPANSADGIAYADGAFNPGVYGQVERIGPAGNIYEMILAKNLGDAAWPVSARGVVMHDPLTGRWSGVGRRTSPGPLPPSLATTTLPPVTTPDPCCENKTTTATSTVTVTGTTTTTITSTTPPPPTSVPFSTTQTAVYGDPGCLRVSYTCDNSQPDTWITNTVECLALTECDNSVNCDATAVCVRQQAGACTIGTPVDVLAAITLLEPPTPNCFSLPTPPANPPSNPPSSSACPCPNPGPGADPPWAQSEINLAGMQANVSPEVEWFACVQVDIDAAEWAIMQTAAVGNWRIKMYSSCDGSTSFATVTGPGRYCSSLGGGSGVLSPPSGCTVFASLVSP